MITITAGDMRTSCEEVAECIIEESTKVVEVVSGMAVVDKATSDIVASYSSELDITVNHTGNQM